MSFVSFAFVWFILTSLLLYYVFPKKYRYVVLLLLSYAFYVITCGKYVLYILFTTVTTYFAAILLDKNATVTKAYVKENKETLSKEEKKIYKAKMKGKAKLILIFALVSNFGILVFLKYANFFIANLNLLKLTVTGSTNFISLLNLVQPLGISFYTFQSMGYLIDLYYGKYQAEKNPLKVALYTSFFPQIIQGPISRFNELSATLFEGHDFDFENLVYGFYRIMWGLFKKLIIADRVSSYVSTTLERYENISGVYLLLAIFLYSFEIYSDFSGGIDITIGVSRFFGVKMTENFERPFFSKSVAEYWRRWHITLGTWFKDYIFYPLSIAKWTQNLGKFVKSHINEALGKRMPIYVSMFIVWATTGLWHGSEWRYVVWGLLNFVILTISTELEPYYPKMNAVLHIKDGSTVKKVIQIVRTFWIMSFLRVFDISKSVSQAVKVYINTFRNWSVPNLATIEELGLPSQEFYAAVAGICIVFIFSMIQRKGSIESRLKASSWAVRYAWMTLLCLAVIIFGFYGIGYDAKSFIYLQF